MRILIKRTLATALFILVAGPLPERVRLRGPAARYFRPATLSGRPVAWGTP